MADTYCCLKCGRWGERGYRPADDGKDGFVCTNDRVCQRRYDEGKRFPTSTRLDLNPPYWDH